MTKKIKKQSIGFAACLVELNGQAPSEIRLFPAGKFKAKDGRPHSVDAWFINEAVAQDVIAASAQMQDETLIDYEHQTLYSQDNGQPAPAAAWFKNLEWRDDGLYAVGVEWTAAAALAIKNKEYRYISPVFPYNKKTGAVSAVTMAALVNYPAIDGLEDLAAAHFNFNPQTEGFEAMASKLGGLLSRLMKEKEVTAEQLGSAAGIEAGTVSQILDGSITRPPKNRLQGFAKVLGVSLETLENTLPEEQMTEALKALLGIDDGASDAQIDTAVAALKAKLDKSKNLEIEVVALKANTGNPDPAKFVPVATMTALQQEVAALSNQINSKESNELISVAMTDGRLLPAQQSWAESLDVVALKAYLKDAQPIAALKGTQTAGIAPASDGEDGLTADEVAICKATGISHDDFKKSKGEK